MNLAYYIKSSALKDDTRVISLLSELSERFPGLHELKPGGGSLDDCELLLSIGGDGTFLSAASFAAPRGIPVMGVNFGRMGFLSEFRPEDVSAVLQSGGYSVEERTMLKILPDLPGALPRYALNEASVSRTGASMLGVDVDVDGERLPTFWADGLLVSTASGSTAYSLSVGGPVCSPSSEVLIIAPISPHNLNVRPFVVPDSTEMKISFKSRDARVRLTIDGNDELVPSGCTVSVGPAEFVLRKAVQGRTTFIDALRSRLLWGEDVRNKQ